MRHGHPSTDSETVESLKKASIPSGRLLAEGVLIVTSILLALTADAWLEDRQNRSVERAELEGLRQQLVESREILLATIAVDELGLAATESLISAAEAGEGGRTVVSDSIVRQLSETTLLDLPLSRVQSLLSSGRLVLIRDGDLRAAIAGWPTVAVSPREPATRRRDFWQTALIPSLRRGHDLGTWLDVFEAPTGASVTLEPDVELTNLFREKRFYDTVTLLAEREVLAQLENLLDRIDSVLAESS